MEDVSRPSDTLTDILKRFDHFSAPSLPHLLALFLHPPPTFPPTNTSLIIIDSVSTILENAFIHTGLDRYTEQKKESNRWLAGRRQAIVGELGSKLSKLATLRKVAILVTNNITTKIVAGAEALLRPSVLGQEWEVALSARIVLFRDWLPPPVKGGNRLTHGGSVRFAEVVKPAAISGISSVIPYTIDKVKP